MNPLRRAYLLAPVVLLASALVPASASAAIKQATYAVKISGTQSSGYTQCPSAASEGHDEAGGHGLETIAGHVDVLSLLKSNTKAVHAEKTIRREIKFGREKIGEEVTTIQWTVHFRRVG